jgi:hypothetical protein
MWRASATPSARVYKRQVDATAVEHEEHLLGLVHLAYGPGAAGIALEHLPAVDEGDAVGLEAVPAMVEPDRSVLGKSDEADPDVTLGHLHQVRVLAGQPRHAQAFAIHFAEVGRVKGAFRRQAHQREIHANATEGFLRQVVQRLTVERRVVGADGESLGTGGDRQAAEQAAEGKYRESNSHRYSGHRG